MKEEQWESCEDCNVYDNVLEEDTFMYNFGSDGWLCGICAEYREYSY